MHPHRASRRRTRTVALGLATFLLLFLHYLSRGRGGGPSPSVPGGEGGSAAAVPRRFPPPSKVEGNQAAATAGGGAGAFGGSATERSAPDASDSDPTYAARGIVPVGSSDAGVGASALDRYVEGMAPGAGVAARAEEALLRHQARVERGVDQALRVVIDEGSVTYGTAGDDLPYLHCGPVYGGEGGGGSGTAGAKANGRELILLHGMKFTKEDWRTSGIMDGLCLLGSAPEAAGGGGGLSVTALDLPASAEGTDLSDAFRALWSAGIIGGDPVFVVSPSASGGAVIGLGELVASLSAGGSTLGGATRGGDDPRQLLGRVVRGWIPVAAGSVLLAPDGALRAFAKSRIPVLAVHGNKDEKGKKSTEKLVRVAGAKEVELEGGHPCYLDSPDEFVKAVLGFLDEALMAEDSGRI